jgi:hypothetical protein
MTAPCPPGCGHEAPRPVSLLCDVLGWCADAVDEAGSGRLPEAMSAWCAARDAAAAIAAAAAPEMVHALGLVIAASGPSNADAPWRADLWHALNKAALALCLAADGDLGAAGDLLLDAAGHADGLPCRPALLVVLPAAWDAREQVTA